MAAGGGIHRGIIPARAGFTTGPCSRCPRWPDHPRSRGVYDTWTGSVPDGGGSSPLARGLPAGLQEARVGAGIIPARAGFTTPSSSGRSPGSDHPRSRGVYSGGGRMIEAPTGSSPLARGLLDAPEGEALRGGIIPARAGFTPTTCPTTWASSDHPRSRGVYTPAVTAMADEAGSSPLARGLRLPVARRLRQDRIIPARAGFTGRSGPAVRGSRDHPRSRGVYGLRLGCVVLGLGSSPLARGLHWCHPLVRRRPRIIPARAGFTRRGACRRRGWPDHPRSRGVYAASGVR